MIPIKLKPIEPYQPSSPIRISTISALSQLKVKINLKRLFETLVLVSEIDEGALSIKYYDKDSETGQITMHHRHSKTAHDMTIVKSHFQNQLTLVWGFISTDGTLKRGNGFVFNNGKIKTVGIKCEPDIKKCYDTLLKMLQTQCIGKDVFVQDGDPAVTQLVMHEMRPTMYNTDFAVHFNLMRDILYGLIVNTYGLLNSEYEPDIYPAVKIKFSWNIDYLKGDGAIGKTPGLCYCQTKCKGKGCGHGDGGCKIVTVCAFQSGKIIITGGNSYEQVVWMYEYINTLLRTNYTQLYYRVPFIDDAITKTPATKKPISKKQTKKKAPKDSPSKGNTEPVSAIF
jgi:TATA-box binding protein (TBP) (component of TFIID and TFIIIB)